MRTTRALAAAAGALALVVLTALPAAAHVTIPNPLTKGGFGIVTFSVPNEMDGANVTALKVKLPTDVNLAFVSPQPKPGWTVSTTMRHLSTPVSSDDGQVTDVVDTVTWSGGSIAPGQFDTFSLSVGPLPTDKSELAFPAIQTYSNGQQVSWIDVTPASGQEPDHPQPILHLVNSTTAATTAAASSTKGSSSDSGKGLAVAALVVAIVALVVGGAGVASGRRGSSA
jgi:uncharacterized protein YcnI